MIRTLKLEIVTSALSPILLLNKWSVAQFDSNILIGLRCKIHNIQEAELFCKTCHKSASFKILASDLSASYCCITQINYQNTTSAGKLLQSESPGIRVDFCSRLVGTKFKY